MVYRGNPLENLSGIRKALHKRLTQSLTQASYARIWIFLSPQALREPYAGPLRGCSLLYRSP